MSSLVQKEKALLFIRPVVFKKKKEKKKKEIINSRGWDYWLG